MRRLPWPVLAAAVLLLIAAAGAGCSRPAGLARRETCTWYDRAGVTASGERFNPDALCAAHPSLPLGTRLLVRTTGGRPVRSVIVRVNDRSRRTLDLTPAAFRRLAPLEKGRITVSATRLAE